MTAAERAWKQWGGAAKLRASGFQDLEGRDRDGPLSDRGNLHVVTEGDGQQERLAERIEYGSAYHTWVQDVLRSHRFASTFEREAWAAYAECGTIKESARRLGVNYHRARNAIQGVESAARSAGQGNQGKQGNQCPRRKIRRLVRQSDPETLIRLAAVLLQSRPA